MRQSGTEPPASGLPSAESVDVRGPDERGACIQLAARWAERYQPTDTRNDRAAIMGRFRRVHAFVDAVTHGVEPPEPQP